MCKGDTIDKQTDRQTDRQTDSQTDIYPIFNAQPITKVISGREKEGKKERNKERNTQTNKTAILKLQKQQRKCNKEIKPKRRIKDKTSENKKERQTMKRKEDGN